MSKNPVSDAKINLAGLQAAADAVHPQLKVTVTAEDEVQRIFEPDTRRGWEGTNKRAPKTPCKACGAKGEVLDAEGDPTRCAECDGRGQIVGEDPPIVVPRVFVQIGHHTHCHFSHRAHVEGLPKMRVDLHRERTHEEMVDLVRLCVGRACFDTTVNEHLPKEAGSHQEAREALAVDRLHLLLDACKASGSHDEATVEAHRARIMARRAAHDAQKKRTP